MGPSRQRPQNCRAGRRTAHGKTMSAGDHHRYHPDHNNLTERFDAPLTEGQEAFTITRDIRFEFSETDLDNLPTSGYGDLVIGGVYKEKVSGLHKEDIQSSGKFRLTNVNDTDLLNAGL